MKDCFVSTPNYQRFEELYGWLRANQFGVDLAAVLGRAGRGKTTAAARIYTMNPEAIFVRFEEWLTHIGLLREIAFATAGIRHARTQACFDLIQGALCGQNRVIMVDEADRMTLKHFNTLRDLHDACGTPIVFIGEEPLEGKLRQERRVMSRVRDVLKFESVGQMDVVVFYREALDLAILPEASADLSRHAQGDFRLVVKDALAIEQMMKASGLTEITDGLIEKVCK
jgi:DNA transposition AAA+ family ATPase